MRIAQEYVRITTFHPAKFIVRHTDNTWTPTRNTGVLTERSLQSSKTYFIRRPVTASRVRLPPPVLFRSGVSTAPSNRPTVGVCFKKQFANEVVKFEETSIPLLERICTEFDVWKMLRRQRFDAKIVVIRRFTTVFSQFRANHAFPKCFYYFFIFYFSFH